VIGLEGSMVRVGKKHPKNKKGEKSAAQKG
jgi:hypothetical protein